MKPIFITSIDFFHAHFYQKGGVIAKPHSSTNDFSFGTHKMKERHNERKERHSYKYGCTDAHLQQFHQNSAGDHINFFVQFYKNLFLFHHELR